MIIYFLVFFISCIKLFQFGKINLNYFVIFYRLNSCFIRKAYKYIKIIKFVDGWYDDYVVFE